MKKKIFLIFIVILVIFLIYMYFKIFAGPVNSDAKSVDKTTAMAELEDEISNNIIEDSIKSEQNINENNVEIIANDNNVVKIPENINSEDIIINMSASACFAYDLSDSKIRNEYSDFIILGKVISLDGGTNYNPKANEYTLISTVGKVEVQKVIKGNINNNTVIPFIRSGGIISFSQYEKGLLDSEKEKIASLTKDLKEEDKPNKFVKHKFYEDIEIENGKTYLMYLKYNEDYDKYNILFFEHGLNELQIENDNLKTMNMELQNENTLDNMMVKNNRTGNFVSISNYIGNIK